VHFRTRTNTDDIEAALQETLQKFQHQTGLPTRLQLDGEGLPLPADVQVQVLHVVQEALSNVRKHADASHVSLDVHKGSQWRLVVRDNGRGFDSTQRHGETHVGTKIMRERAERIGATVRIESRVGQGTTVTLTLPANPVTASGVGIAGLDFSESVLTTP
jgi:two-component system, NarL family, nitrate/nitrite sensor histidine kinase NarX